MGNSTDKLIVLIIIILIAAGLTFYTFSLQATIAKLKNDNLQLSIDASNFKRESESLRKVLNAQNKHIKALVVDNVKNMKELSHWKSLPPKIRYRTITKFKEAQSDECKDIKASLGNIRNNGIK